MFGTEKLDAKLGEVLTILEEISGQLETMIRLLQVVASEDSVSFDADEEAFGLDGEAMTA